MASVSHRESAPDISHEQEAVMLQVAHHGVTAAQFCGPPVPLVIIADGAIAHHGQHVWEYPLMKSKRDESRMNSACDPLLVNINLV